MAYEFREEMTNVVEIVEMMIWSVNFTLLNNKEINFINK
jgi:hypothetical protein